MSGLCRPVFKTEVDAPQFATLYYIALSIFSSIHLVLMTYLHSLLLEGVDNAPNT